jgi:hypothetical protein
MSFEHSYAGALGVWLKSNQPPEHKFSPLSHFAVHRNGYGSTDADLLSLAPITSAFFFFTHKQFFLHLQAFSGQVTTLNFLIFKPYFRS